MIFTDIVGIVADDLTGANDTALQFFKSGACTKILLDSDSVAKVKEGTEVWALSSESRNVSQGEAVIRIGKALKTFSSEFSFDHYYKKIDSTLRGNIAVEILTMLDILGYDASVIIPAFPSENRITVGGYHLAKGIPIGKTEMATDPHSPITESHVPTLLQSQLHETLKDVVGHIELRTILNGAGPILAKLNSLVASGKKLIVADAISDTDIEQLALAMHKCDKKILPSGTAAGARAMSKYWLSGVEKDVIKISVGNTPRLIISGTATKITAKQILKLQETDKYEDMQFIPLEAKDILSNTLDNVADRIINYLNQNFNVCVHTSDLVTNFDGFSDTFYNAELTREKFASKITDYLAELTKLVLEKTKVILILLGGETSYKCCKAINSNELRLLDEVAPAISICSDINNQLIITKSGNLGNSETLVDILNYLEKHE